MTVYIIFNIIHEYFTVKDKNRFFLQVPVNRKVQDEDRARVQNREGIRS